jgi:carboxyl-terminal processing protease
MLALVVALMFWRAWNDPLPSTQLQALRLVHETVMRSHVEEHDAEQLLYEAIQGLVRSTDEYGEFVPPAKVESFEQHEITNTFQGIGVTFVLDAMPPTIRFPLPGSPAERAGLEVGDRILAVDGQDVVGDTPAAQRRDAHDRIQGPVGETVTLRVERFGRDEPLDVVVERGSVRRPAARWARLVGDPADRIGYVRLVDFQRHAAEEVDAALTTLDADADAVGGPLRAVILDLRGNGGGLLTEALALANTFLENGVIVSLKRRGDEIVEVHRAEPGRCTRPSIPLAILVDARTASASEVVAGALQDHDRALLVGQRTYGKGVVQSIYRWSQLDFRLKLTTSHYYTPNGRSIEKRNRRADDPDAEGGLPPDVAVPFEHAEHQRILVRLDEYETPRPLRDAVAERLVAAIGFQDAVPFGPQEDPGLAAAITALSERIATGGTPR